MLEVVDADFVAKEMEERILEHATMAVARLGQSRLQLGFNAAVIAIEVTRKLLYVNRKAMGTEFFRITSPISTRTRVLVSLVRPI